MARRSSGSGPIGWPLIGSMVAGRNGLSGLTRRPPGRTKDIADTIIALLRNGFITRTVLHADGRTPARLSWRGDLGSRK